MKYCSDCKSYTCDCKSQRRYQPVKIQSQPVIIEHLATPTDKRYFKLHNGDILDTENKMILNGELLKSLLDD